MSTSQSNLIGEHATIHDNNLMDVLYRIGEHVTIHNNNDVLNPTGEHATIHDNNENSNSQSGTCNNT